MSKIALVTGIKGQDGAYISEHLLKAGYRVIGTDRRRVDIDNWRLRYLGIEDQVEYAYLDLMDIGNIHRILKKYKPDEIYNLAAQSFVGISFDQPTLTTEVNAMGVLRLLEAVRLYCPEAKFYQASTSEMFGKVKAIPQNEDTAFYPRSPYGVAKLYSHFLTINYRESFDLFACSGILFNHESPLRGLEFVTRKITNAIARIENGLQDKITLGNMDAKRDWGFAKDYTLGMIKMMHHDTPDDYVLSTGETHSVREFVELAFDHLGKTIVWEGSGVEEIGIDKASGKTMVEISPEFFRPAEVDLLLGDPSKAKKILGWEASTKFSELVTIMMESDLEMVKNQLK